MLSVLLMEQDDAFSHLLKFYCPSAQRVFDITYGKGTLVRNLPPSVEVCGIDLAPKVIEGHKVNIGNIFSAEPLQSDAVLFDPPYLYGRQSEVLYQRTDDDWKEQHTNAWTPDDFLNLCVAAAKLSILSAPLVFVKVMNSRIKGRIVDNCRMATDSFISLGWELKDSLVYIRLGVGVFRNNKTAQVAHGFWQVFTRQGT